MLNWFVIAAGGNNWMTGIIPVVLAIVFLLRQIFAARNQMAPPARNKPQRRPPDGRERPLRPAPRPAAGQSTAQLNAEIEQFLKRAGEKRGDRTRRESPLKAPVPKTPLRADARPPRSVEVEPMPRREFDAVAESVAKHLAHRGFSEHTEHLADDIVRADQQMEEHLQKAFNRRVGTLGDTTTPDSSARMTDVAPAPVIAGSTAQAALTAFLTNPQNLKQAVILSEIFVRPEHRW